MEQKNQYTPGPWKVNKDFKIPVIEYDLGDGGEPLPIVGTVHGVDRDMCIANARLIAAAPELLEAAEAILMKQEDESWFRLPKNCSEIKMLRDAVSKATGQPEQVEA